jgi:hypothetical protein
MGEGETKTERGAIKIVDGYITVEIVRRKKQPSDKGKTRKSLRSPTAKKKRNGRTG